jgi:hypothetical protein
MNEKLAKSVFIFATGFGIGCVSSMAGLISVGLHRDKKQGKPISWGPNKTKKTPAIQLGLSMSDGEHNVEVLEQILEQSMLPTLISAQQMGWSPEVFEGSIRAQYHMLITIMTSLYKDGQREDLSIEEFTEKIKSEIKFIVMSTKEGTE